MKKELNPKKYVEFVMEQMNWNQAKLVELGCGSRSHISEMLNGKRQFTKKFIKIFCQKSFRENMAWHIL